MYGGPLDGRYVVRRVAAFRDEQGDRRLFVAARVNGVPQVTDDGMAWIGRWEAW